MRVVKYKRLPCVGAGTVSCEGNLLKFVHDLPYLFLFNLIPNIAVFNDIFSKGLDDAGMSGGCIWEPFAINKSEYDELVEQLLCLPDQIYRLVDSPEWVATQSNWHIWIMEFECGIPAEKHKTLSEEEAKWSKKLNEVYAQGNRELYLEYHLKAIEAGNRLVEFIDPYLQEYRKRKKND